MDVRERIAMLKEEIEALSDLLRHEGLMTVGSQGQPVAHPALAQRHTAIALLHKLESRLTDEPETDPLADFMAGAGA